MRQKPNLLFFVLIVVSALSGCTSSGEKKNSGQPTPAETSVSPASSDITIDIEQLKGKWLRSDGTYTIEVFSVSADGKADAGYFNPGPINVEKAEWKKADNKLYFRIILKDVNYPGSNYTLEYVAQKDVLVGNYFQAVQGLNYDVTFTRVK